LLLSLWACGQRVLVHHVHSAHIVDGKAVALCIRYPAGGRKSPGGATTRWQHAGENLEPQIFFVAQAVGAALDHTDLVVEPLDVTTRFDMTKLTGWGHNHISTLLV
jgi:hypothetical protein